MEFKPLKSLLARLGLVAVALGVMLSASAQTLELVPTINSTKATPVTDGVLNALQGTGSMSLSFKLDVEVSSIEAAYYIFDNTRYNIGYTIDAETHKPTFTTDPGFYISFAKAGIYAAPLAYVEYRPYDGYNQTPITTLNATLPYSIRVWEAARVEYSRLNPAWGIKSGGSTPLSVTATGGNTAGWRYNWSTGATTASINYTATNTTNSLRADNVTVTTTNMAPDGTSVWETSTEYYSIPVYPEATFNSLTLTPGNFVFAGTTVNYTAHTAGGNSDGWNYTWTGVDSNNGATASFVAKNDGTTPIYYETSVQATNIGLDGSTWFDRTMSHTVTIWPAADATLDTKGRTAYIAGEQVTIDAVTTGGDPSKWTYRWVVNNTPESTTKSTLNITPFNNGAVPITFKVQLTATNTPDNIDAPKVVTRDYEFTVYPAPAISSLTANKQVVYSETPVTLTGTVAGGQPDGWTYEWAINGTKAESTGLTLTDSPVNNGTTAQTYTYTLTATNNCEGTVNKVTQDINVTVWPKPEVELVAPTRIKWLDGQQVPLSVTITKGATTDWTYQWKVDGNAVAETSNAFNYLASNTTNAGVTRKVTVTAINAPAGIDQAYVAERIYECIVYPTPAISSLTTDKAVVFTETPVKLTGIVAGGDPDGWKYEWTINGTPAAETRLTLTDSPVNNGTNTPLTYTYKLTATNTCDATVNTFSREVTVTVWPQPKAELIAPTDRTQWINGETVPFSVNFMGMNQAWTFQWKVDGTTVAENSNIFNYLANNTTNAGLPRKISVTVINAPEGIDKAYVYEQTYDCIVYPTPAISAHNIDKPVTYTGTDVTMSATTTGGNPQGWEYSWTMDGSAIDGTQPTLTVAPANNGDAAQTHKYVLTAKNTCEAAVNTLTQEFEITVWPTPSSELVPAEFTEWFSGAAVSLDMAVSGGDPTKWTYSWSGPQVTTTADAVTFYPTNNSAESRGERVTVTVTNTPDGIDKPYTATYTYDYTVYPLPRIASANIDHPVIYNGESYTMNIVTAGGNPDGWTYSWTRNNADMTGEAAASLTDSPANNGTASAAFNYVVTAVNKLPSDTKTLTYAFDATVWPNAHAELITPMPINTWLNGENVEFSTTVQGGDPTAWTYKWTVDGTTAAETSGAFTYVANNTTAAGLPRKIVLTATNTPEGIANPYVYISEYNCTVYPTPAIATHNIDKPVTYTGTDVTLSATTIGGNPQGWEYSWTMDGSAISGTQPTLTVAPANTGNDAETHKYVLTAVNTNNETVTTVTQEFEITVWPAPGSDLVPAEFTDWFSGAAVSLDMTVSGGDPDKWTYSWSGPQVTSTAKAVTFNPTNTGAAASGEKVTVTVTNTPDGIDKPYTATYTYDYTVYPTPVIESANINYPVVFSGTSYTMNVVTKGGNPDGWTYSWTRNFAAIAGTTATLTDSPANNGTASDAYTYVVTAVNTLPSDTKTLEYVFEATVWPMPTAELVGGLPDNMISGDQVEMPVALNGGDPTAWHLEWRIDGNEAWKGSEPTYTFAPVNNTHDPINQVVTVQITNAPDNINEAFLAVYSHTFTVWPGPNADPILGLKQVTCDKRSLTLGVDAYGGQNGNWAFSWTLDGAPISGTEATLPVTFANTTGTMRTDRYVVRAVNTVEGEIRYDKTFEFVIDIYPAPVTTQGRAVWDAYYENDIVLYVKPEYGYPYGWKYEWSDELPDQSEVAYTIPGSSDDSYKKAVTLTVTNGFEDVIWYTRTYTYDITCWSKGTIWKTTDPVPNYNGTINMLLNTDQKGGYTGGWTYEWSYNGKQIADGQPNMQVNETNYDGNVKIENTWTLVATNTLEGVVGSRTELNYVYNLWQVIDTPSDYKISQTNVSDGTTIMLYTDYEATGGYLYRSRTDNNWNYNWTANGTALNDNRYMITQVATMPQSSQMSYFDIVYQLQLTNPAPEEIGGFWFDRTYQQKTVRVYGRPSTPIVLERKGNGTTCTMVVLMGISDTELTRLNYRYVFGYTDAQGADHAMTPTAERFYRFDSSVYNNSANDFWVYAVWNYDNGVTVTSARRHLNGQADDFDGSDFNAVGRGDASGIADANVDDDDIYIDARGFKLNLSHSAEATVRIYSIAGSTVFEQAYPAADTFTEQFGSKRLVPGVYIVSVEAGNVAKTKKFVIK